MSDSTSPVQETSSALEDSFDISDDVEKVNFTPISEPPAHEERGESIESIHVSDGDVHRGRNLRNSNTHVQRSSTRNTGSLAHSTPTRQQPMRQVAQLSYSRPTQQPAPRPIPRYEPPSERTRKKPGPKPWATKPPTKNDMVAKQAIIAEIEMCWGNGFIKGYIPKCHRPLVKKGKTGKRSAFRQTENDPKKWMPSVLKAILMIAAKTDDKQWLKEQMRDVVTYRIKHTGNRKPQLVTTDFDVIEDVFSSGWTVAQSFAVRYKHLLLAHTGAVETDEDIAHIFGDEPRSADSGDDGEDGGEDGENVDEDDYGEDGEMGNERSEDEAGQGLSSQYFHTSGYVQPPQYPLPIPPTQSYDQPHPGASHHPQNRPHDHRNKHHRPLPNVWAPPPPPRPRHHPTQMPPRFTPSPSYADSENRSHSSSGTKRPRSPAPYNFGENKRGRRANLLSTPTSQMSRLHMQHTTSSSTPRYPSRPPTRQHQHQHQPGPKIKVEPGLEDSGPAFGRESYEGPDNYLNPSQVDFDIDADYNEDNGHDLLRLELEAAEAEANRTQLRLRFAQRERKKNQGTTACNPVNVE